MDDLEFIQSCANGDKHSWEEFLSRYSRLIYNYVIFVLKKSGLSSPKELANDIFHELLCSLLKDDCRKLKTFKAKNGSSFATWLRVVTINFTIDYLRKQKSAVSLDQEDEEGFTLQDIIADKRESALDAAQKKDILERLEECLKMLDEEEKYFLELHISQGVKLAMLKDYFKVSRGAIDMHKSRIISKLRECFRKKGIMLDS